MSAVRKPQAVAVEDYLAAESKSQVKHEYLGGFVYAMAGGTNAHNRIASNVLSALHQGLAGTPCEPFNSDTKVRIRLPAHTRLYYPDVSVVCDPNPPTDTFHDRPVLIAEVLSRGTRRIDQGEKKEAYLTIPTLCAYVLIEQDGPFVTVYRRTEQGFAHEVYADMQDTIVLSEIGIELPLAEIYERVEFIPEPEEEDS